MTTPIQTPQAPAAIGPYSQAIQAGQTVYISGQIGLDPSNNQLAEHFSAQAHQVFQNLRAIAQAAGGDLANFVKLTVFVTDLSRFAELNDIMQHYFTAPFPARAAVQAAALPKNALIEVEAIMVLP